MTVTGHFLLSPCFSFCPGPGFCGACLTEPGSLCFRLSSAGPGLGFGRCPHAPPAYSLPCETQLEFYLVSLRNLALDPSFPIFPKEEKSVEAGPAGVSGPTSADSWSEVVPSHEAAVVSEGWGAGASGLAAQGLGDVAVALVVAVICRTGMVPTDKRVLHSCRGSREVSHTTLGQLGAGGGTAMGNCLEDISVSFPHCPFNLCYACGPL